MQRKILLAAALAAGSLVGVAHAVPAVVATPGTYYNGTPVVTYPGQTTVYGYPGQATVMVQPAPPAPIYEPTPAPRSGYVWSPGHHEWRDGRYVWMQGQWVAERPGYAWQASHWEQRGDGSWVLVGGSWVRSDNVAVYGRDRPWRDRDGDGVRNRDDRYPNNPYRN